MIDSNNNKQLSYYLGYLTANDDPTFIIDFLNLRRMIRYHPGVSRITIIIAISIVNDISKNDLNKIFSLVNLFKNNSIYEIKKILIKNNIGRDFSSAEACLKEIAKEANEDDYIMLRNRSGYGPFSKDWYSSYISQYSKLVPGGLVGSTINFAGHPKRIIYKINTHIQTYVYLSQWKYFVLLTGKYPGSSCYDRVDLINEGEIGLSRFFLNNGLQLSCLHWKDDIFDYNNFNNLNLSQIDIKKEKLNVPIRYKYKKYFDRFFDTIPYLWWKMITKIRQKYIYSNNKDFIKFIGLKGL